MLALFGNLGARSEVRYAPTSGDLCDFACALNQYPSDPIGQPWCVPHWATGAVRQLAEAFGNGCPSLLITRCEHRIGRGDRGGKQQSSLQTIRVGRLRRQAAQRGSVGIKRLGIGGRIARLHRVQTRRHRIDLHHIGQE